MQKDYLKNLRSKCKGFAKKHNIFDIVLYGSFVRGINYNDIDIMIIFVDTKLNERLKIGQQIKKVIDEKIIDVKTMNLSEFFDKEFLPRSGILVEGLSLLGNKKISEKIGVKGSMIFTYGLKNMNHNEKTKFTYALIGRNSEGMLKKNKGVALGRGAVKIPIENSGDFEEFLNRWNVKYKKERVLSSVSSN